MIRVKENQLKHFYHLVTNGRKLCFFMATIFASQMQQNEKRLTKVLRLGAAGIVPKKLLLITPGYE
jgi:hypothetical protein